MTTAKKKISLKKKGGSQLMSAQKGEAMATFHAALQLMGTNQKNKTYIVTTRINLQSNMVHRICARIRWPHE